MNNDYDFSYIPKQNKPYNTRYKCPISKEKKIKKYSIIIDGDFENNQVYLNLGYDNKEEYDSSFFLTPQDAKALGDKLIEYSEYVEREHDKFRDSRKLITELKRQIKKKEISSIKIKCIGIYCTDIHDTLFGTLILNIQIKKINDDINLSFRYLSDSISDKTESYFTDIYSKLKSSGIEDVYVDIDEYKKCYNIIKSEKDKLSNQPQKISPMIPRTASDNLQSLVKNVQSKLKEKKN